MKWKFSLPGVCVALLIVAYESYKFAKEIRKRDKRNSNKDFEDMDNG